MKRMLQALCTAAAFAAVAAHTDERAATKRLLFVCSPTNELLRSAQRATPTPPHTQRFDRIDQALAAARKGDSALLVLADAGYPTTLTQITAADYTAAARRGLRLFVEFPAVLPTSFTSSSNATIGTEPLPMDKICGVSTSGTTTVTRLVSVSNATGLAPMRILQQNQAVALPVQLGPGLPPAPPPSPAGCACPVGYSNHAPGYWSNPTPNTTSTKPPISVAACAAKCTADTMCVAFEVFDPAATMQCHTFEGTMRHPFTTNSNMCTCVKGNGIDATAAPTKQWDSAEATRIYVVGARVAGYDTAVFGLPPDRRQQQIMLFSTGGGSVLVCSTQLSNAVAARNGPIAAWSTLFSFVINWAAAPGAAALWLPPLVPSVRPRFSAAAALAPDAVTQTVAAAVAHLTTTSGLLYSPLATPPTDLATLTQHCPTARPADQSSATCMDEGLSSYINAKGNATRELGTCPACGCRATADRRRQCANTRTDDNAQSAVGIAVGGVLLNSSRYKRIAAAIVDYIYTTSGAQETPQNRSDGSRGLVDWFTVPIMVQKQSFWGDNDGTVLISTAALAGLLYGQAEMERLVPKLLHQMFGLLRTTGVNGFRPAMTSKDNMAALGWRPFFDGVIDATASMSIPHMQANAWAAGLWAGHATGVGLFQERVYTATELLMERWPQRWQCEQTETEELAHEILVLAWLVRVNNTAQPRAWLDAVASDLIAHQRECGAIREWMNSTCAERAPTKNAAYGTGEGGLMQENTDPSADLLYAQNFALMSLHEASHAVGLDTPAGRRYSQAVDKLAEFFVRVQVQSTEQRNLDGAWMRAVDVEKWEYWAAANDYGYGPWETETGWTIGWVSATLGLRRMNSSFWEAMQVTADAIDGGAAHAVCLDFFEELGSVHCGQHDAGPPPPAPTPPLPAPAPPAAAVSQPPAVNEKVYHHLVSQFSRGHAMFQHFGVSTFGHNNTLGVGGSNDCWHGPNTMPDKLRAPCLPAELFNPTNYSAEQTMQVAAAFGASEVCITAHHEGGFTLWPSNHSGYGVHHSAWKGGRGDILAEFAAAARAAGIRICYYIGPNANGWMLSQNYSAEEFLSAQLGEFRELLSDPRYGPVHRLWIDHPWQTCHNYSRGAPGPPSNPRYTACPPLTKDGAQTFPMAQLRFNALVKQLSPATIMGGSEYWNGPTRPQYPFWYYCNRSHATIEESGCWAPPVSHNECSDAHGPAGDSFRPIELTGSAIGGWFGPAGDREHLSAGAMWELWLNSVGVGGGWILNLPPTVTGQIPAAWARPALEFGRALKASFSAPVASLLRENVTVSCGDDGASPLLIPIPAGTGAWNAIRSSEDVYHTGQLVSRYLIEAQPLATADGGLHSREPRWLNVTSRGRTVGVGTVDQIGHPRRSTGLRAVQLRWTCQAAARGAKQITLSSVELFMLTPPSR